MRRGPYAKTAARRAAIARAALDSFAEHGYERASLRDIARRAGLTHAGLLHHFRDKDELLAAALTERDAQDVRRSTEAAAAGLSGAERLTQALRHNLESPELVRTWAVLSAAASSPEHPAHAYFTCRYAQVREAAAAELRDATAGQPGTAVDAQTAATLILAVLDGLQLQWLLDPHLDIVAVAARFAALLLPESAQPRATSGVT
ncbi:MAG TPA: TetR/AcrR family transcriptional regulator [Rugosimonospora sp.]|nr:TetR/AcrR family transcriptional regulator [Rugosimonospora sp.]